MEIKVKLPSLITSASVSLILAAAALTGCNDSSNNSSTTSAAAGTAAYVTANGELKGDFSESVTLEAGKAYKIAGEVNFLDGTTLTIPAGVTLYGSTESSYLARKNP